MAETIRCLKTYEPVDPDTGECLPLCTPFIVEGVGFGVAELIQPDAGEAIEDNVTLTPEVQVRYSLPGAPNYPGEGVTEIRYLDPALSSRMVVAMPEILIPLLRGKLGI